MDPNKQKEEFNYAYVCALAAHAGLNKGKFEVDDDSIDVVFRSKGYVDRLVRSPQIEFQLKCTSQDLLAGEVLKFQLSRKNYDDLRGENFASPRYLAVLVVPEKTSEWLAHNDGHIALFNNCYWVSLRNAPETNNDTSITVDVPIAQRLTSDTLKLMIERASHGEWL
jgi:hypothetical protein